MNREFQRQRADEFSVRLNSDRIVPENHHIFCADDLNRREMNMRSPERMKSVIEKTRQTWILEQAEIEIFIGNIRFRS